MSHYADLLIAQGNAAADAARQRRNVWADFATNLSQLPGQVQQQQQRRELLNLEKAREQRLTQSAELEAQTRLDTLEKMRRAQAADEAAHLREMNADPEAVKSWLDQRTGKLWTPEENAYLHQVLAAPEGHTKLLNFLAPLRQPKVPEPFTLGKGQIRYSPEGTELARGPEEVERPISVAPGGTVLDPKTLTPAFTAPQAPMTPYQRESLGIQRERLAKEPDEPLVPVIGPDGKPVLVRRSQAEGKTPASSREQGRPVTSGDAGRIAEIDASLDDVQRLGVALTAAGETGTVAKIGASMPNWVTDLSGWGVDAKKKQALIDRVKQVIGKALEGGVLRKEDELKYEKILPTIADTAEVVKSKLAGLDVAVRGKRERTLEALGDAGYDVSRFQRTERTGTPAPTTTRPKLGDIVTVKGTRLRVTKINLDGSYEGVGVK